jgi:hypothetical protein
LSPLRTRSPDGAWRQAGAFLRLLILVYAGHWVLSSRGQAPWQIVATVFWLDRAAVAPGDCCLLCAGAMKLEHQIWRCVEEIERRATSIGILLAIFCLLFFVELASFSLSIDEEIELFGPHGASWIGQGRWGAYLVERFILTRPILPFLPHFVFGLACVGSYLAILTAARIGPRLGLAEYGSFAVFCGFPTWFFISEFSTNVGAVGIALFCATLAVCIGRNSLTSGRFRPAGIVVAIAFGAFAIAIYQTFLLYMIALALGLAFLLPPEGLQRQEVVRFGFGLLIIAGSVLVYFVGDKTFKWWFGAPSGYVDTFFDPGYFFSDPFVVLKKMFRELGRVYGFSSRLYTMLMWATPMLLALGIAAFSLRSTGWSRRRRAVLAVAAVAILFAPLALNVFSEAQLPLRALVGVPFVVWLFTYAGLASTNIRVKMVSWLALLVAIYQFQMLQNTMHALNALVARHDLLLAASLQERLAALPGFSDEATYPIAVFGGRTYHTPYAPPATSPAGNSFFGWDGGNPVRIAAYLNAVGLSRIRYATPKEMAGAAMELSRMPVWPSPHSVALSNGVLLVRLGQEPNAFNKAALATAKANKT